MNKLKKPTILLVDDNPDNLQVLAGIMENSGYELAFAMNGNQVFDYISVDKPDLILLDVMMPDIDGYEVCSRLKRDEVVKDIPIIFLTAKIEVEDLVKGFEVGGVDYITKPFNVAELKMRVKTHLELKQSRDELKRYNIELQKANELISMKNMQLTEVMAKLELASTTDTLTGLFNRRYMIERIKEECARYQRCAQVFSISIADIDLFKNINDRYGHLGGDAVLREVADLMKTSLRRQDCLARWGGEEFIILMPDTQGDEAAGLAERLRRNIEALKCGYDSAVIQITMTFGVAEFTNEMGIDATIKKADDALYKGKKEGRNRVVF